jgi:hypothetical protein
MKPTTTMLMTSTPTTFLAEAAHAIAAPYDTNPVTGLGRSGFDPAFARRPAR